MKRKGARLLVIALVVSISISCLGLFGLATLTARRRTKEIGIRKVLGAGIGQIVFVLSKKQHYTAIDCYCRCFANCLVWDEPMAEWFCFSCCYKPGYSCLPVLLLSALRFV